MVITKTPFRMSFFGGGTDLQDYFLNERGAVISTTLDKYCYVTVRHLPPFFDFKNELSYSKVERVNNVQEISHPLIRNAMEMMDMHRIRLTYEADLPARSGLGTSSSFAVGMLNGFYALKGKYIDKKNLADKAIYLERILCNESGGWQDQIAASFGGLNRIDFAGNDYDVHPIIIAPKRKEELENNLMLFFTGFTRFSAEIQNANKISKEEKRAQLREMYEMVNDAHKILVDANIPLSEFGKLLGDEWRLKRGLGKQISTNSIDTIYMRGIKAGALGGKLLGAGGGGFLLFYVEPELQESVLSELKELVYVPFKMENNGSQIIHYTAEVFEEESKKW